MMKTDWQTERAGLLEEIQRDLGDQIYVEEFIFSMDDRTTEEALGVKVRCILSVLGPWWVGGREYTTHEGAARRVMQLRRTS
jgi:hypothetical protein